LHAFSEKIAGEKNSQVLVSLESSLISESFILLCTFGTAVEAGKELLVAMETLLELALSELESGRIATAATGILLTLGEVTLTALEVETSAAGIGGNPTTIAIGSELTFTSIC
jgi:hypothetical protein